MSAASEIIRQHLEALPEYAKAAPWCVDVHNGSVDVLSADPNRAWAAQQIAHVGSSASPAHRPTAKLIALLASPHVAEALAELLEHITNPMTFNISERLYELAGALEAAISREGRSE